MYDLSDGVRPGGKYISRNSQKGVLSNAMIILRPIMTSAWRCQSGCV